MSKETYPIIEQHDQAIDTLTKWSEEDLSDTDQAALAELAIEDQARREADGYSQIKAEAANKIRDEHAANEAIAQQDNDWRQNPDIR